MEKSQIISQNLNKRDDENTQENLIAGQRNRSDAIVVRID